MYKKEGHVPDFFVLSAQEINKKQLILPIPKFRVRFSKSGFFVGPFFTSGFFKPAGTGATFFFTTFLEG